MPSINVNISSGTDDGYQGGNSNGATTYRNYAGTNIQVISIGTAPNRYTAAGALRFQNVSIPQGATINSATLSVIKKGIIGTAPNAKIYGDNVDNAPAWATTNRVKHLSKTAHFTSLDTTNATSINDVTAVVQDIVNRAGWAANHAMAFGLFPNNTGGAATHRWSCYAYEKGNPDIPNLSVTYTSGGATPTVGFSGVGGRTGTTGQVGFAG